MNASLLAPLRARLRASVPAVRSPGGRRGALVLTLVLVLALLSTMAVQAPAFSSPPRSAAPIVSGDLIVKFRDTSEAGVLLAAVLGGTRTVESAAPLAARLSERFGVPLRLVQVTSGREALLAIDRDALMRSLAERAAREPGVVRAATVPQATPGLAPDQATVRLELTPQAAPSSLAARLASGPLLRPRVHGESTGAALVSYDMPALTLALLERLKQHEDVEYAQPNRLLRAVGEGKPVN